MSDALAEQVRRLEQQINAFEQLHGDELRRLEAQLAAYRRLQADELHMLRDQLRQLREAADTERRAAGTSSSLEPVVLTVARRADQ